MRRASAMSSGPARPSGLPRASLRRACLEPLAHDPVWRLAVEDALAAGVVGGVEASGQLLEIPVRPDGDAEHLAAHPAIEALRHAIRPGRARPGVAALRPERGAGPGEARGEAAPVVGQDTGEAEGKGDRGLAEGGDRALLRLLVLPREVDGTGPAVDGDVVAALAPPAVGGPRLRRVFGVDVPDAEIAVPELALAPPRPVRARQGASAQPLGAEDAPDAVAVQVRQEVGDDEGEVVEREAGGPAKRADHGPLLLRGLPGQAARPGGVV